MKRILQQPVLVPLIWFMVNVIQAFFTELNHDEAYYRMYARHLDWGYFDHPPMIGWIIWLGSIIPGSLGVRLVPILMSTLSLVLVGQITKKYLFTYLSFTAVILLHLSGFIAFPDSPLLFFSILWLYLIRQFLSRQDVGTALALGATAAFLLYSKYHGILVLGFTVLAYPGIFRLKYFWLSILSGVLLYLPHILWLADTSFETITFQLFGRGGSAWRPEMVTAYLRDVALVLGPLVSIPLIILAFQHRRRDVFDRILWFNLLGVILFFLVMSFRGWVEANWLITAAPVLVVLALKNGDLSVLWKKILFVTGALSMLLYFGARLHLISPVFPVFTKNQFTDWDIWAASLAEAADGRPVVFINSYQKASKYMFYTQDTAHSYNWYTYKKTQYHYWPYAASIQGREVVVISNLMSGKRIDCGIREEWGFLVQDYRSYENLTIKTNPEMEVPLAGDSVDIMTEFIWERGSQRDLRGSVITISIFRGDQLVNEQRLDVGWQEDLRENQFLSVPLDKPVEAGEYRVYLSVHHPRLPPGINGEPFTLRLR